MNVPTCFQNSDYRFVLVGRPVAGDPATGKRPIEAEWPTKANYAYNDDKVLKHDGNVGFLCGNGTVVLDCDEPEAEHQIARKLPATLVIGTSFITSGFRKKHFYYNCLLQKRQVLEAAGQHIGEVQAKGQQVLIPPSTHFTGIKYEVLEERPIANVTEDELMALIGPYLGRQAPAATKRTDAYAEESDPVCATIKEKMTVPMLMGIYGFDLTKNPTQCMWHESQGKKSFGYDDRLWHCFHCGRGGNIFHLVMAHETCSFMEAKEKLLKLIDKGKTAMATGKGKTLNDVHAAFNKWLKLKDTDRVDAALAVALTKQAGTISLWLIFVGPSGDGKTEIIKSFDSVENEAILLNSLTSNTLVTGYRDGAGHAPKEDLAPQLDKKIVLIPDMSQILFLNSNEKAQIWAQFRDLYDGYAGKETGRTSKNYKDLRVTLMAASTPVIDDQLLFAAQLGTRELIYRTDGEKGILEMLRKNMHKEAQMQAELKEAVASFLAGKEFRPVDVTEEEANSIFGMAEKTAVMRCDASHEWYSGELMADAIKEVPARLFKQLLLMYQALRSLDESYPPERALNIVRHVARSTSLPLRIKVADYLARRNDWPQTTSQVANELRLGKKTVLRQLSVFQNLGYVEMNESLDQWGRVLAQTWRPTPAGAEFFEKL